MTSEPVCVECGNDEAVHGHQMCPDCLIGVIPDGWYVLWCERCLSALMWTEAEAVTFPDAEWATAVVWAADQAHPHTCFGPEPADAEQESEGKG